jgi:hypothetical protein
MAIELFELVAAIKGDTGQFEKDITRLPSIAERAFNKIVDADERHAAIREHITKN